MSGEKEATFRASDDELQKEDSEATLSGTEDVEREGDLLSFVGQHADLEDANASFEESSTSSNETDLEHGEQLGMSLRSLHGNLMNSQQGHFEQSEPLTKNNWQDAVQAIQALITRSKKQRKGKMQSTGMNGANLSCANGWDHTGAKPKSTVPGALSSSLLDNKVLAGQSHVKDIHEQLSSGGGSSIGFSLHGAPNGDHLRDLTGTLRCVPLPPEHGGRQTTDHWLQQPQETPKLSLEPEHGGQQTTAHGLQQPQETSKLSLESGFIGVNGTSSSCANGWEHTGAKPKSTVPGAPSSSVLDKKVSIGQSHVKGIHEQLSSGGGSSIGFSLHGASNGDHLRDRTGTLRCVLPPPEHGGRQTTDHWLQQPQETPKLSLEPECIDMEGISNGANEWNGLPHETLACGINPEFLAQHSTDPLLGGYTTSSAEASNTQNHLIQQEQNEVHCMQHNMPSEQDDIVRWSSTSMERERIARRWCSCCRDDPDSMPICEVCYRHRYCGPGYRPQMNRVDLCCHCFEEVIGQCIMFLCGHKAHKDCVIAAIRFNMLNCPTCGKDFLHLA